MLNRIGYNCVQRAVQCSQSQGDVMCKGQKIQSKDKRKREKYKISDGQNQTNKSAEIELSNLRNPVDSDTFQNVSKQSLQNPRYLDENKEDWE